MVAGMRRGLSREDAARFAFLLATPVILAAGTLKIPDLFGPLGDGIRGQILLGSVLSGIGAYLNHSQRSVIGNPNAPTSPLLRSSTATTRSTTG
jgi:bacitracin resistance protein BacA